MNKSKKSIKHNIHYQTKKNLKNATYLKSFIDKKLSFNTTDLISDKNLHKFFIDILLFIKKTYKINNTKYKIFEKFFNNYCDSILPILKQHNEFYITNINIKCKSGGKRGKMLIPYQKWCEIDEPSNGVNIDSNLNKNNSFFINKKDYCENWDKDNRKCIGYYWDYINPMRFLTQDIDVKTLILKLDNYSQKCKLWDKLSIEYKYKKKIDKSLIKKINKYNLSFKNYLTSITNFNWNNPNSNLKNFPQISNIYKNNDIWYELLSTLSNIFLLYYLYTSSPPSIITNDILKSLSWLLLLISSFIKNT